MVNAVVPPGTICFLFFVSPLGQAKEKLGKDLEQLAARYTKSPEILLKAFLGAGKGGWTTDDASSPFLERKVAAKTAIY